MTYAKRTQVTCKYCGKQYTAHSKKSKYGCLNYECTVAAEKEQREYHTDQVKKWQKRKRQQKAGSTAKS